MMERKVTVEQIMCLRWHCGSLPRPQAAGFSNADVLWARKAGLIAPGMYNAEFTTAAGKLVLQQEKERNEGVKRNGYRSGGDGRGRVQPGQRAAGKRQAKKRNGGGKGR